MNNNEPIDISTIYWGVLNYKGANKNFKRRVIFTEINPFVGRDLYYDTPYFEIGNENTDTDYYVSSTGIYPLEDLLISLGFNSTVTAEDLINFKDQIFNGIYPYQNHKLFGYEKKSSFTKRYDILDEPPELEHLYNFTNYELTNPNSLSKYFHLLYQVNYQEPESIFKPNEEVEGPIKKRVLGGKYE